MKEINNFTHILVKHYLFMEVQMRKYRGKPKESWYPLATVNDKGMAFLQGLTIDKTW